MSLTTLTTNPSDVLDGSDLERAGEFLHDTPETAAEFRIPTTETPDVTVRTFVPTPAAPYVPEVDYHAAEAAEAVERMLKAELGYRTEVANASHAVTYVRGLLLEDNLL